MAATFLGRMCLSGDVHDLDENQMTAVKDGIALYHRVKGAIRNGSSRRYGSEQLSYTSPEGWQAVVRTAADGAEAFAVIHTFKNSPGAVLVPLNGSWEVIDCYKQDQIEVSVIDAALCVSGLADFNGLVVKLKNDELENSRRKNPASRS
jgi:alpha-galactosidase